ncbi:glutathione S-transferase family protein [Limibacillus halophilus]|jgi:glutathione S-transferase
MSTAVQVFGAAYSVYVRAVRLALEEKGVSYDLVPVDIFAEEGPPPSYSDRHPLLKIPAFQHGDFRLYESDAILRYIDAAFPGPALQPALLRSHARANQMLSILNAYAYRCWVWDIYVERVAKPAEGGEGDERRIADALPRAATCLDALAELMEGDPYLLGGEPYLPDLLAAPMIACLRQAEEGSLLLKERPRWLAWWEAVSARESWTAVSA